MTRISGMAMSVPPIPSNTMSALPMQSRAHSALATTAAQAADLLESERTATKAEPNGRRFSAASTEAPGFDRAITTTENPKNVIASQFVRRRAVFNGDL